MKEIFKEAIIGIITIGFGVLVGFAKVGLSALLEWFKAKTSKVVYDNAISFARGIYEVLEDQWNVSGMGERKRQEMNRILKKRFPSLTSDELDAINKDISKQMKSMIMTVKGAGDRQETSGNTANGIGFSCNKSQEAAEK